MPIDPASVPKSLRRRHVLLCVGGGIAAYKTADWASQLTAAGVALHVAMTASAQRFVGSSTYFGLTGNPVFTDLFSPTGPPEPHVWLSDWAELILVAPATANIIARIAAGEASDIVTATLLASRCPIVIAPAMSDAMWSSAAVQHNLALLSERGMHIVPAESGRLASGHEGFGRLASTERVFRELQTAWLSTHDLAGIRVLVSAGGTREPIDPVRFIGNSSSGKMGFAIAQAAALRGAEVVLVSTASHPEETGVKVIPVNTAAEMLEALTRELPGTSMLIMAAAVADYRPTHVAAHKIKKDAHPSMTIELTQNPDILAHITSLPEAKGIITLGFAAEDTDMLEHGKKKREAKGLDAIFVNDVSRSDIAFGSDYNEGSLILRSGEIHSFQRREKKQLADELLNVLRDLSANRNA